MNFIVSTAAMASAATAVSASPTERPSADAALLEMEERIFEHKEAAQAINPELDRLRAIWEGESLRLFDEARALVGDVVETEDQLRQRYAQVDAMPECTEHKRLLDLQDTHWDSADELVSRMWALPAQTPEGRRSKLLVLLGYIMDEFWRHQDDHHKTSYEIKRARDLMIEFVGGEPSAQLRDQFS
jgi:hypothetical protein